MRTSSRSFGGSRSLSSRARRACSMLAVCAALTLPGGMAQGDSQTSVRQALDEVLAVIPGMNCQDPEVWTVDGDSEVAARSLLDKLEERGWNVVEHGATGSGYAVIADPDPDDPSAYAIGGLVFEEVQPNVSAAYLARCTRDPQDEFSDPSYYT